MVTFIYCGEVNVKQECLEEFMATAKTLKIKGLADDNYYSQPFDSGPSDLTPAEHLFGTTEAQYQSIQCSIQSNFNQQSLNEYQKNGGSGNDSIYEQNYDDYNNMNNFPINDYDNTSTFGQWNTESQFGSIKHDEVKLLATEMASKRIKPNYGD